MTGGNNGDPTGGDRAHQTAGTDGEDIGRPRITALLRQDHEHVNALFKAYEACAHDDVDKRRDIIEEIRRTVCVHTIAEEDVFYRALESHPECQKPLVAARRAHEEFDKLLAELSEVESTAGEAHETFQFLLEDVRHHVRQEETVMFDLARRFFSGETLRELGVTFRIHKEAVRQELGFADGSASAPTPGSLIADYACARGIRGH